MNKYRYKRIIYVHRLLYIVLQIEPAILWLKEIAQLESIFYREYNKNSRNLSCPL